MIRDEPATFLFFWDYDTQWGADRSRLPGGKKSWGMAEFENTERLLELHAEYGIQACFAVVGAAALPGARPYHDPFQIRKVFSAGHEIASHSFRHDWLPAMARDQLIETLSRSKDALEQCIGSEVATFVPPYNQPFDYVQGWSFSFSERREARRERTDLSRLCSTLFETGYRFCRVAYRPMHQQIVERVLRRRRPYRPSRLETICGVTCVRLNTPVGFKQASREAVARELGRGGIWVLHGHPHSVTSEGSPQSLANFRRILDLVDQWKRDGKVRCLLPRDLGPLRK